MERCAMPAAERVRTSSVIPPVSTAEHPLCPVCDMSVDPATAPKSIVGGKTYYFCSASDKATFDGAAQKWINALR